MNLIVNVSKNWAIGKDNNLLFHISADMKFFKSHTIEKTVIMGRKTLESLPKSKPLPKRRNIVLTRNKDFSVEGADIFFGVDELLDNIDSSSDDLYVMGGESLYRDLLPYCDTAYVTKVDKEVSDADAFMVNLDLSPEWYIDSESETMSDNGTDFKFITYKRK